MPAARSSVRQCGSFSLKPCGMMLPFFSAQTSSATALSRLEQLTKTNGSFRTEGFTVMRGILCRVGPGQAQGRASWIPNDWGEGSPSGTKMSSMSAPKIRAILK